LICPAGRVHYRILGGEEKSGEGKMRSLVRVVVAATTITIFAGGGCSSLNEDWERAQARDTLLAYEGFLKQHPASQYEADARNRMSLLKKEQARREAATKAQQEAQLAQKKAIENIDRLATDASPGSVKTLIGMLQGEILKVEGRSEFTTGEFLAMGAITQEGLMRETLVEALGRTRNRSAVPILIRALKDPERSVLMVSRAGNTYFYRVREAAARSLKAITGQDFGVDAVKWSDWWQKNAN
jgi:hypothetical protein